MRTTQSIFPANADRENFPSPLHKICSTDDLRPILMCINFTGGYAYATDAHCLIRQSFAFIGIEGVENLEGKSIHKEIYYRIYREDRRHVIVTATPDHLVVKNYKLGTEIHYPYFQNPDNIKFPDYEKVINTQLLKQEHTVPYNAIGVFSHVINRLINTMWSGTTGNMKIILPEKNSNALLIVAEHEDAPAYAQLGLVMPVMLSDHKF